MRAKCGARPGAGPSGRFLASAGTGTGRRRGRSAGRAGLVQPPARRASFSFCPGPRPAAACTPTPRTSSAVAATPFKLAAGAQPVGLGGARARGGPGLRAAAAMRPAAPARRGLRVRVRGSRPGASGKWRCHCEGCAPDDGPGRSGVSLSESLRWRTVRSRGEEANLTTRMDPNGARPPLRDETAAPSKNWSCYYQQ
jgi:hypothetical protein